MGLWYEMISPKTLINHSLLKWQNHHNRGDTVLPLSNTRKGMAAYCYVYHMNGGCNQLDDDFWADKTIRQTLLREKFDHHKCKHRHSCFKKRFERQCYFPYATCSKTYIHEDMGYEHGNKILWRNLDLNRTHRRMVPWMVIPKWQMCCQYVNVQNHTLSELFNCNTNVQVGDPFHIYYNTLCNLKSTQEEDGERRRKNKLPKPSKYGWYKFKTKVALDSGIHVMMKATLLRVCVESLVKYMPLHLNML